MIRRARLSVTAACALLPALGWWIPRTAGAQFPPSPPPAAPLRPMQFPPFQEVRLSNGVQVILVENHELPIVSLSLAFPAGSRYDPAGKEGLAELTAALLTKGTPSRTADQIAAAIEGVGGSLSATAGADWFTVSSTVLTDHVELALELLADVLLNASFPQSEFDLAVRRFQSQLQLEKSDPGTLARRFFARELYGDHPYGRSMTESSLAALSRDDVVQFARSRLKPGGAYLIVAGDMTLAGARELLERYLRGWSGSAPTAASDPEPPAPRPTQILLVHRPGSAQSNILVGNLAMGPRDPVYYAITVGNRILGGGTDARLFKILREQKGWTYGAYSSVTRRSGPGFFAANTEVRTPVTDSALVELLAQLRRFRTEIVPDSELAAAKGYLIGSFPRSIETPQQIASQVTTVKLLGLGDDYLRSYRERLAAVTAADIRNAARRVIRPDSAVIVVVGDGEAIYDKLVKIAPVRIVDPEGKPLTVEDLKPKAEAVTFDPAQLVAGRDSFQVLVQGNPFGYMTAEWARFPDSLVYTEETVIAAVGLRQKTVVRLDPNTLAVRSVERTGQAAGQNLETAVSYQGGRVRGRAQTPDPRAGTPRVVEVDTTVAEGTLDASAFQPLVAALPLAEGSTFSLPVFEPAEERTRILTVKVAGVSDLTVPAGDFPVYRVEVSGTPQPFVFYVTREAPRRLVKIEIVGQPLTFELTASRRE
ncbi:putative zinc protease [bacterium HR33]|nr:putative zinc protease [bacterium HR33]